jgi:CelD/BcsL family acetyltransferase involved in cellulose biosynthesis
MHYTLHTSFPESLKEPWNDLLAQSSAHVPFLRYEVLRGWWQTRGGGEWSAAETGLAIVTAEQDGALRGIAPLFWARQAANPSAALYLLGAIEISDYLDLIAGPQDLPAFADGLLPYLASTPLPAWTDLHLHNLLEDSPSLAPMQAAAARLGWQFGVERLQHCPYIPLPGDWETYLAGIDKKQRHEIRRKMRRAEESGQELRWYLANDPAALDAEAEEALRLMANDPEKAAFLSPLMRVQMKSVIRAAFEGGWLQLAFLTIDGQKAAFYLNFDYHNRVLVYNSGLDRAFLELSPGWVLLGYLLQWANENKRERFDFMRGNEDYKYRFGATDRYVVRLSLQK